MKNSNKEIDNYFKNLEKEMISWRHHLHQNPELGFEEKETADFIENKLRSFGFTEITRLTETGIVASLRNQNQTSNEAIGLRADIDALPMSEDNDFAHRSKNKNKMHACGHDGHTTMLLAAAKYMIEHQDKIKKTVHFIFQPAEEGLAGGKAMCEAKLFEKFHCDQIFGLHNWPGLKEGKFAAIEGCQMAGAGQIDITIKGSGGHAAMPHLTNDCVIVVADIIHSFQKVISRNINPAKAAVISITQIHVGDAYNVISDTAKLKGGFRYLDIQTANLIIDRMKSICENLEKLHDVKIELKTMLKYPPTINTKNEVETVKNNVCKNFGSDNFTQDITVSMGSEDFSYMLNEVDGCYVFLGAGENVGNRGLHCPNYDFNDNILKIGASYWVGLAS